MARPSGSPKRQAKLSSGNRGADAVAHGFTGKGNDQFGLNSLLQRLRGVTIIAPWREWTIHIPRERRNRLCEARGIMCPSEQATKANSILATCNTGHPPLSHEGAAGNDPRRPGRSNVHGSSPRKKLRNNRSRSRNRIRGRVFRQRKWKKTLRYRASVDELIRSRQRNGVGPHRSSSKIVCGASSPEAHTKLPAHLSGNAHRELETLCLDRENCTLFGNSLPALSPTGLLRYWFTPQREAAGFLLHRRPARCHR